MNVRRYLWVPIFFLLAATGGASAQSDVGSKLEKLEETVRVLERRLAVLEEQLRQQSATAPAPPGKVNWRKLQKGLSETDVEKLLGSPSKVDAFGSFTIWHYGYPSGGKVHFDGGSRSVSGWREP